MSRREQANQRRQKILLLLELHGKLLSRVLSQQFKVSYTTIRNDIIYLEKAGFLKRTKGGAVLCSDGIEIG